MRRGRDLELAGPQRAVGSGKAIFFPPVLLFCLTTFFLLRITRKKSGQKRSAGGDGIAERGVAIPSALALLFVCLTTFVFCFDH
jgi:hypothetical protein